MKKYKCTVSHQIKRDSGGFFSYEAGKIYDLDIVPDAYFVEIKTEKTIKKEVTANGKR